MVLIVEDEADIREAVRGLLERTLKNVTVLTAASGEGGLKVLQREPVDLIVSDYKMPQMSGVEFLAEAERLAPRIPRILITAFEQELAKELGARVNVDSVFTKPLDPRPLVQTCQRILAEANR